MSFQSFGVFSCKSFFRFLCEENAIPLFEPAALVWKLKLLPESKCWHGLQPVLRSTFVSCFRKEAGMLAYPQNGMSKDGRK